MPPRKESMDENKYLLDNEPRTEVEDEAQKNKRARLVTVEPVVVFYFMSIFSFNTTVQEWMHQKVAQEYSYTDPNTASQNGSSCQQINQNLSSISNQIQAKASLYYGLIYVTLMLPSLLTTILLGSYSDKTGRKTAVMIPLIGTSIQNILTSLVIGLDLDINWIFVGTIIGGIGGGSGCLVMSSFACIADVTSQTERLLRFVIIDVCIGIGNTFAQIGIGFLIQALGFFYPMLIICAVLLCNLMYVVLFVPETISKAIDATFFTCDHLVQSFKLFTTDDGTGRRWKLNVALAFMFSWMAIQVGAADLQAFYFLNPPLCWSAAIIGIFLGYSFLLRSMGSIVIVKVLGRWLKGEHLIIISILTSIAYYLFLAGAAELLPLAYLAPLVGFSSNAPGSMIRTLGSQLVQEREQGALLAVFSWALILSIMLGNLSISTIYMATLAVGSSLIMLVICAMHVLPLGLIIAFWIGRRMEYQKL